MDRDTIQQLIAHFDEMVFERRADVLKSVLSQRTRHLCIVLEDIFNPMNASAVARSCECFGVQDIHTMENWNECDFSREVTMGAHDWLSFHHYQAEELGEHHNHSATKECLLKLKTQGYRLIATTPHESNVTLETVPLEEPVALVFGSELRGISDVALDLVDDRLSIPMQGFTESLNLSVTVAICLQQLTARLRASNIHWQLPEEQSEDIYLDWLRQSVKNSEVIERIFLERLSKV